MSALICKCVLIVVGYNIILLSCNIKMVYCSQADVGDTTLDRQGRQVPCIPSPPTANANCIVCNGETTFQITGNCWCDVCRPGRYMKTSCECAPNGTVIKPTDCKLPELDEGFMPESNFCDKPYPCTECEGALIPVSSCKGAEDRRCDCPPDTYEDPSDKSKCLHIPRCPKDYQIQRVPIIDYPYFEYGCVPIKGSDEPRSDNTIAAPSITETQKTADGSNTPDETGRSQPCICPPCEANKEKTPTANKEETPTDNSNRSTGDDTDNALHDCNCLWYIVAIVLLIFCVVPLAVMCGAYNSEKILPRRVPGSDPPSVESTPNLHRVVFYQGGGKNKQPIISANTSMDTLDEDVAEHSENNNDGGGEEEDTISDRTGMLDYQRTRRRSSVTVSMPSVSSGDSER
ncbi:uncharacterized protein [Amphiura filiformis]|uniref:uncharacterized protein n=1 Tax=Amphiura filiformis TaxID=82378 RepID=UPI003B20DD0C